MSRNKTLLFLPPAPERIRISGWRGVMDRVDFRYKERARDHWYADHEIKAIWNAANKLDPIEGAYVKLLLLLAPRKTALAMMRRADLSEFDDKGNPTIWTTPHELTKTKATAKPRSYLTPLPLLAQRQIKGLPASDGGDGLLFPGLSVHHTKAGRAVLLTDNLRKRLVGHGAPKDFNFHAARHTIATWLRNKGRSDFEIGLILNHAGTGVTARYGGGFPLQLKRDMLTEWADHIERLVGRDKDVRVLR